MIKLKAVSKTFPKRSTPVLSGVSFEVQPGEIFGLLGPNGAGKTTLLRIIATLILPSGGTVEVAGHDVLQAAQRVRRSLGCSFGGERSFYFRLTAYQNLEFFGALSGITGKRLRRCIEEVLERVGLAEARNEFYMKFSTGMKRKLSLAKALMTNPEVFLLDEPNSGIDPASAVSIRRVIEDLRQQKKTILLTTHDMNEANRLSDRIGVLRDGRIVAVDTPSGLKGLIQGRRIVLRLADNPPVSRFKLVAVTYRLTRIPGVLDVSQTGHQLKLVCNDDLNLTEILRIMVDHEISLSGIATEEPSLEDVFIKLTSREVRCHA